MKDKWRLKKRYRDQVLSTFWEQKPENKGRSFTFSSENSNSPIRRYFTSQWWWGEKGLLTTKDRHGQIKTKLGLNERSFNKNCNNNQKSKKFNSVSFPFLVLIRFTRELRSVAPSQSRLSDSSFVLVCLLFCLAISSVYQTICCLAGYWFSVTVPCRQKNPFPKKTFLWVG